MVDTRTSRQVGTISDEVRVEDFMEMSDIIDIERALGKEVERQQNGTKLSISLEKNWTRTKSTGDCMEKDKKHERPLIEGNGSTRPLSKKQHENYKPIEAIPYSRI